MYFIYKKNTNKIIFELTIICFFLKGDPPKNIKFQKQRFRCSGKTENKKNSVSVAAEEKKNRKTTLPLQRKSKKQEKQRFRCSGRTENKKNSVSVAAEEQKTRKTTLP